jgi:uncharacterized protein DUF5317
MFMPFAFLLLLLTVPLAGGRLSRLAGLRVRGVPLICGALGLQVVMTTLTSAPHVALIALHAASYAVIAWVIGLNRAVPGLLLIAVGGGTNAAVIALNGGTLPARREALVEAGFSVDPEVYRNSGIVADPVLPWLGDIMATPAFLPFRNVISLGDLVVLLGGAVLLHVTCRTRLTGRPAPPPVADGPGEAVGQPAAA